jgi:hypothetical protein
MSISKNLKKTTALAAIVASAMMFHPSPARAAFVVVDGLNRGRVIRANLSVAVVRVARVHVNHTRKRQGYVQYRHLDLTLVKHLYGPRPRPATLKGLPYQARYNSAWPMLGKGPVGTLILMAWVHGHPCGVGLGVRFGPRIELPMVVSSVKDPKVKAVITFLHLNGDRVPARRKKRLVRAFEKGKNRYLALIADQALKKLDSKHGNSYGRYLRLLALIDPRPGADPMLGWPILKTLVSFQAVRTLAGLMKWVRGGRGRTYRQRALFVQGFRYLVQKRLLGLATKTTAEINLRRWAVMSLASAPSFIGTLDAVDRRAVKLIRQRLQDPRVEMRRTAISSMLTIAAKMRKKNSRFAKTLVAAVRAAQRRERSGAERAIIQRRIDAIWANPTP